MTEKFIKTIDDIKNVDDALYWMKARSYNAKNTLPEKYSQDMELFIKALDYDFMELNWVKFFKVKITEQNIALGLCEKNPVVYRFLTPALKAKPQIVEAVMLHSENNYKGLSSEAKKIDFAVKMYISGADVFEWACIHKECRTTENALLALKRSRYELETIASVSPCLLEERDIVFFVIESLEKYPKSSEVTMDVLKSYCEGHTVKVVYEDLLEHKVRLPSKALEIFKTLLLDKEILKDTLPFENKNEDNLPLLREALMKAELSQKDRIIKSPIRKV